MSNVPLKMLAHEGIEPFNFLALCKVAVNILYLYYFIVYDEGFEPPKLTH